MKQSLGTSRSQRVPGSAGRRTTGRGPVGLVVAVFLALWIAGPAQAQVSPSYYDFARPGLEWYSVETEHFEIIFHADADGEGSGRTARVVARIAEEVYEPITSLYGHEPGTKVHIVLKDFEDYSNGAAYFFDNKIEIWAPALDSPLRGDHSWLRNVITHEFTHIVQVQASMKSSRRVPFYYFQLLGYEDVKRPDVLYGYPDVIVSYPLPVLNNPAWLAEGTAQYQRAFLGYDSWDSHRDMLLRTRVLAGEELSLAEMGGFYSHSSLLRESVYNHGFAFTSYLADRYGEGALRDLSRSLGAWSNWNVERALRDAVGRPGGEVYEEWIDTLRVAYEAGSAAVRAHLVEGELVEEEGFSNFYPVFSPTGDRLAYVTNRGEHFNLMSLVVRDLETGEGLSFEIEGLGGEEASTYTCALGHRLKSGVGGKITWRPDGAAIAYARTKITDEGYLYSDLFEIDVATKKVRRLTREQRAAEPAYGPEGRRIAFVGQRDGTTNLYVLDVEEGSVRALTSYGDGTQVSDPTWDPDGRWIYFGRAGASGRDLYRVSPDGGVAEAVVATPADERTPAVGPAGDYLYYASDETGIFNLYRFALRDDGPADPAAPAAEQLTNVLGGAFMPSVAPSGKLAFARYDWDGYKIALLAEAAEVAGAARGVRYEPPAVLRKGEPAGAVPAAWEALNDFDDSDLVAFTRVTGTQGAPVATQPVVQEEVSPAPPAASAGEDGEERAAPAEVGAERYGASFTSFSFFPVLRLDQYVTRRSSGLAARVAPRSRLETAMRNTKVGVFASSREVLEEMSLLAGLLVGPTSRDASSLSDAFSPSHLLRLERDAFLQFDYRRGLPFVPKRWSPQLSVELYNIRRNVENGLSLEEFPCTACLPDTTLANLSYSLWEGGLYARSKVSRSLLLELGYRYSPYKVTTERFFSKEADTFIPESSSRYYIGRTFLAKAYFEALKPHRHADVLPEGLRAEAGYELERGRLLDQFAIEDGMLVPKYASYRNHRLYVDGRLGQRLPGTIRGASHGIGLRLRASTVLGGEVDDFFNDYVGGLIGARGYAFYALGGNETLWLQAAYHVPLLPDLRRQVLFAYFDKLYARLFADAALAWSGAWPGLGEVRRDVGAELRLGLGSFYLFPTAIFLSATYGLDAFDLKLDEGFLTPDGRDHVRYGQEVLWHFGLLFGFDL